MIENRNTTNSKANEPFEDLLHLGWSSHFQAQIEGLKGNDASPARVAGVSKNSFRINDGKSERLATVSGKLQHNTGSLYPVTGDWVLVTDTVITEVLLRKNALSRGAAGARGKQSAEPLKEQVIAANLDTVFVVCGLDRDFNLRRIERYLTLIYNCGLNPVIILTKADLHPNPETFVGQVETVAFGVPIHPVSAYDFDSLAPVKKHLSPGQTTTLIGSSGAGKSTLVNLLWGQNVQATGSISESLGKGKHTTTSRDLIIMPQGGMVIDNPGLREIAFWDDDGGIEVTFPEIDELAANCRFSDCNHMHEPGCRVLQALAAGELSQDRLESYRKMKRELSYLSLRQNKSADRMEKEKWKEVALKVKSIKKGHPKQK